MWLHDIPQPTWRATAANANPSTITAVISPARERGLAAGGLILGSDVAVPHL
ncbi:MAG TPA: hypothetical protein VEC39_11500 [Vicinamibacterales bacterium]|nr:hypothetical protein [Vicinamibacterales bacterium]